MLLNDEEPILPAPESKKGPGPTPNYKEPTTSKERNAFQIAEPLQESYQTLPIKDSLRFLCLFDPAIRSKQFTLHRWQVEVNEDISYGRTRDNQGNICREVVPSSMHPYKFALCAANGSGKDAFVIAPVALWFICTKIKSKVIITSASGAQLSTQTEHYIATLAREVNNWSVANGLGEILKVRKRHIYCLLTGGVIHMFATDEGEKAEGHHPTAPGCEMLIIVNEAKSVSPVIFDALKRCTGFNYWLNVSSPGEPIGNFYQSYQTWPNKRRVTYFDCPHQSPEEFEEDRRLMGEHSHLFRSKWLALFTFTGGRYVIPQEKLQRLKKLNEDKLVRIIRQSDPIRIGIDIALSVNGDETVISVWQGNRQIGQHTFRIQDSIDLADNISAALKKYVKIDHKHIFADDGGVGRSVIDILNRRGFKINRVLNNSTKNLPKGFRNRGAQLWYKFSRLVEEGVLIFNDLQDDKLFSQLASRKYKETDGGIDKMTLEPKRDMISQGLPSPDRADAAVLAFTDAALNDFLITNDEANRPGVEEKTKQEIIDEIRSSLRRGHKPIIGESPDNHIRLRPERSLQRILRSNQNTRRLTWKS